MKVKHLQDDPGGLPGGAWDVVVTDYEAGDWEGSGYALLRVAGTGELKEFNLGHCSCYGPWEYPPTEFKDDEYVLSSGHLPTRLVEAFRELCNG